MSMSTGMGAKTGVATRIEMRVERGESLGTFEVEIEVGRKTREEGRRQRLTRNHSRKTTCPSEPVASCEGSEPRDGRRVTGLGRAEDR